MKLPDQDRRQMRDWVKHYTGTEQNHTPLAKVARYVLDTVEAPTPTLAEELRAEAPGVSGYDLAGVADRVEQIEQEVAEADRDRDEALRWVDNLTRQRDEARADLADVTEVNHEIRRERDELRAEVERLTDELNVREVLDEDLDLIDIPESAESNAESSAESLDPADVKPGEAWLVRYHGHTLPALRRIEAPGEWYIVRLHGTGGSVRSQDITLVTRLVPGTRRVTDNKEN